MQLNKCVVSCVVVLQSGHVSVGCVVESILCRYCCKSGDLLVLS